MAHTSRSKYFRPTDDPATDDTDEILEATTALKGFIDAGLENYKGPKTCAGVAPAIADLAGWLTADGEWGIGIGSGGAIHIVYATGAATGYYVAVSNALV